MSARSLARRGPVRHLGFRLRKPRVIVRELIEVGPRDLRRHDDVIAGHIRLQSARAVLKLDVHPHPEPLEAVRLLYLILFLCSRLDRLTPRPGASKDAEIPVLRHQLPALRQQICAPKLSGPTGRSSPRWSAASPAPARDPPRAGPAARCDGQPRVPPGGARPRTAG
jgi:hypothetical protein